MKEISIQIAPRNESFALRLIALFALALLLTGCAGEYTHNLKFSPQAGLRVAVLPFVAVDSHGQVVDQDGRLFIDNLSLVSSAVEEQPVQIVRKQVFLELRKTGLDTVSPVLIDIDLPHHGFARADGSLDIQRLLGTPPQELCSQFVTCDALLYGKVTDWDRQYLGLESVNTVGLELKLVSAKDGKVLFEAKAKDSDSRGLSKIPTGFSSLVIEPIRGLDSEIISDLSKKIIEKMLEPLTIKQRQEFLDSAPPSIFAAAHAARYPHLNPKEPLIVVMFGSENMQASFSVGTYVEHLPMSEQSPGHYYGEFLPLASDHFDSQPVTVFLRDKYGRETTQQISKPPISLLRVVEVSSK